MVKNTNIIFDFPTGDIMAISQLVIGHACQAAHLYRMSL